MYSHEEVFNNCLKYFDNDTLAVSVIMNKYLLKDPEGNYIESSPDDMLQRISKEFQRIESNYPNSLSAEEIDELLMNFKYLVPGGSPLFGIGNDKQLTSIGNCFVIKSPEDTYADILERDKDLVQIMKRRGGVGVDVSKLRPSGSLVNNAAKTSDGIICFMERYSNTTKEVAQGGRRGALMISVDCNHPDLIRFINIKRDKTKITGANISIKWNDAFLKAVEKDEEYTLRFPVDSSVEDAQVTRVIKAKEVWDDFVESNWESAEPGCLFWDSIIGQSLSDCYEDVGYGTVSTNPCIVGNTLIAVADGRNAVSIKQLAEEGNDVPVYCVDDNGTIKIETLRHPRITNKNAKIYEITLSDGSIIKCTEKHKFILKNNEQVMTKDLLIEDSLLIHSKWETTWNELYKNKCNSISQKYWMLNTGKKNIFEHKFETLFSKKP